ncbi:MAG: HNH endonuclease signature motif containing protein [Pseudomonadota bacterium]
MSVSNQDIFWCWEQAKVIPGSSPFEWRLDPYGWFIRRQEYGQLSEFGWEIDHRVPKASGGTDSLRNLQAMHWKNNRAKGARVF